MRGRKSGIHNAISLHRLQEQWHICSDTYTTNATNFQPKTKKTSSMMKNIHGQYIKFIDTISQLQNGVRAGGCINVKFIHQGHNRTRLCVRHALSCVVIVSGERTASLQHRMRTHYESTHVED